MDRRLKERLIGAVVLVGIGAWLIPWVLDGPPHRGENEPASLELPIPDEPIPLRTQTIRLDDRGASQAPDPRPSRPVPADTSGGARQAAAPSGREEPSGAASTPDSTAAPAAGPSSATSAQQSSTTPRPEEEEPALAAVAPAAPEPTEQAAPAERSARETPAERPEPDDAPASQDRPAAAAPAAAGDWVVQLGSFGEEQNARRLADRVATHGYSPNITNLRAGGRLMHRVRVGPYETRERAQETASALTAQGFVAQVVSAD